MKIEDRENVEWTNWWVADANRYKRRCMLIGDSTTRQIRGSMELLLMNVYAVDMFATSFSVFDSMLMRNLKLIFSESVYEYDFIILHYGGHHGFTKLCSNSEENYKQYYCNYLNLAMYLQKKTKNIVLVTSTSEVDEETKFVDEFIEEEVKCRNSIVWATGKELNCIIFDLYTLMKQEGSMYKYFDRQHFIREADIFISYHLLTYITSKGIIESKLIEAQRLNNRHIIETLIGDSQKYIIYGAGVYGNELYWLLKFLGIEKRVNYFAVSLINDIENLNGKRVVKISDIQYDERRGSALIICSEKYEYEMQKKAIDLKFSNIILYRVLLNSLKSQIDMSIQ